MIISTARQVDASATGIAGPSLLSARARLADAADDVTDISQHDRLPVWIELAADDVLRATLAVDAVCAGCAQPVRPYGPAGRASADGRALDAVAAKHRHDCGTVNVPHAHQQNVAALLDDDDLDVRRLLTGVLQQLYQQVESRRRALDAERQQCAQQLLVLATSNLARTVTDELPSCGPGQATAASMLARLGVPVLHASMISPAPAATSVVHVELPERGALAQRWRQARLSAHVLTAGTCNQWRPLSGPVSGAVSGAAFPPSQRTGDPRIGELR